MNHRSKMRELPFPVKVHLGCGSFVIPGWINLDGSWNAWISKYPIMKKILKKIKIIPFQAFDHGKDILIHDFKNTLPFNNDSVEVIYASHLLEHLYFIKAKSLLRECHRILIKNGVIRMVVPDLKILVKEYLSNDTLPTSEPKADIFIRKLHMRSESPPTGNILFKLYETLKEFHSHKWMYDEESLIHHFKEAGFLDVKKCDFQDSLIEDIGIIEKAEGIYVEGVK